MLISDTTGSNDQRAAENSSVLPRQIRLQGIEGLGKVFFINLASSGLGHLKSTILTRS